MSGMVRVGMAEYKLCSAPQKISTVGLGSCLGVVLYDNTRKICGMAHIMMPDSTKITKNSNRMKFADTCIEDMYADLIRAGADPGHLIAKIAGGANMFDHSGRTGGLNIGHQNGEAVRKALLKCKVPIVCEDVGKNYGRTIEFDTVTGELHIHSVGRDGVVI